MPRFISIMNHSLNPKQREAAQVFGEIVELEGERNEDKEKVLLIVPDQLDLDKTWFETRAEEVLKAVGGVNPGDVVHAMGQQQLAAAINAAALAKGSKLVESVTKRTSKEELQTDGSTKKTNVFTFVGYRVLHTY